MIIQVGDIQKILFHIQCIIHTIINISLGTNIRYFFLTLRFARPKHYLKFIILILIVILDNN